MAPDERIPAALRTASRTAVGVAWMRAAHQHLDGAQVLDDPVIVQLLPEAVDSIARHEEQFQTSGARGLRAHVVLRSRFAEDALEAAVARGIRQYVILGAGLDTFAYRQPTWGHAIRIFEIDQAASQEEKRALLATAGISIPSNVSLVPVDFEHEALDAALRRAGAELTRPVFVSWLGVTMYLTRAAVRDVLRTIATLPSGSEIVFTFAQPRAPRSDGAPTLAERAAEMGEPWLSYFTPAEIEELLRDVGFSSVDIPTVEELGARYFSSGHDALPPPRRVSIARAVV